MKYSKIDCKKCNGARLADWDYESSDEAVPVFICQCCGDVTDRQMRTSKKQKEELALFGLDHA